MNPEKFQAYAKKITDNCSCVIVGKEEVIHQIIVSFLCGGHVLLEDVPGTGKTMLFRSFSRTVGGDFKRIQFTPDLLPSDLTGINFYNQKKGEFEFRPGPLFANMILADEINRATPRTQSALLDRDTKEFTLSAKRVVIAQILVPSYEYVETRKEEIYAALHEKLLEPHAPDLYIALYTSVSEMGSDMFAVADDKKLASALHWDEPLHLPGVVSRKKDFVPKFGHILASLL